MQVKEFSNLLPFDSSSVIVAYNGFGKLEIFAEIESVTTTLKLSIEAGDIPWIGGANKEILQHIDKTIGQGYEFRFDPETKVVGTDRELFVTSGEYTIPSFLATDNQITRVSEINFSTKEWIEVNKFGAIAQDKVYVQATGNLLALSAIMSDGVIATNALILDSPLSDEESVNFSIPKQALFVAQSASIEIGQQKILIESTERSSIWAIDPNEAAFFPGLIPEGAIEISVSRKELKPLLEKGGKLKINVSKKGSVQIKSTNGQQVIIEIGSSVDVPPRTSFQVMAEAVESAIKLIGTAKLITLALPVGLQYIAVSAAAVRCLLPTIIDTAKALTAKEITSSDTVVLKSETTTVEVENGSEVTMTVEAVEKLNIPESPEPASKQEAIAQLESGIESAKEAIARIPSGIPAGSDLDIAKQAIQDNLVEQAQAVLSTENKQSVFSKEDIKKITNAIARMIARIEAIRLDLQTWELQVTFRN